LVRRKHHERHTREARPVRQRRKPRGGKRRRPARRFGLSRRPDDHGNDRRGCHPSRTLSHCALAQLGRCRRYGSDWVSCRSARVACPDELWEDGLPRCGAIRLRQRAYRHPDSFPDCRGLDLGRRRLRTLLGVRGPADGPSGATAWGHLQRVRPSSARVHVGPRAQPAGRLLLSSLRKHLDSGWRQRCGCIDSLRRHRECRCRQRLGVEWIRRL